MSAYYCQLEQETHNGISTTTYRPLVHAQGAWNQHEQHMAPATGVLCYELEHFQPRTDMRIGRISLDIFGLIPLDEFTITTQVIRAGKTIELVEACMQAQGKTCIVARAWRMQTQDSSSIAALEDQPIATPENLPKWNGMERWAGGFIRSMEFRVAPEHRAGKGIVWLTNEKTVLQDHPYSEFAHIMGMIDTANGIVPRQEGDFSWAFPNLDLQIHLHRLPQGKWLGLETVQQYGADGIGLTSSILHDIYGPFGRSEQILTLRKL